MFDYGEQLTTDEIKTPPSGSYLTGEDFERLEQSGLQSFTQIPLPDGKVVETQTYLQQTAELAYRQPLFKERNTIMAEAVAYETSFLAARSIDQQNLHGTLLDMFYNIVFQAGSVFSPAFTAPDEKLRGQEYHRAYDSEPGRIARDILAAILGIPELDLNEVDFNQLLSEADFGHAITLTAHILGIEPPSTIDPKGVRELLTKTTATDIAEFRDQVTNMRIPQKLVELDTKSLRMLNIAVRLANATWKVGQVHRAFWELSTDRIDPDNEKRKWAFNPYDDMLRLNFEYWKTKGGLSEEKALIRTAFEVFKDFLQYKPALAKQDGAAA